MRDSDSLLPLTETTFEIFLALANGELHGYAILQAVKERTRGRLSLYPGTLYRALARLLELGLVEELESSPEDDSPDERRRYYRLTDRGRRVAGAEYARLSDQVRAAKKLRLSESSR